MVRISTLLFIILYCILKSENLRGQVFFSINTLTSVDIWVILYISWFSFGKRVTLGSVIPLTCFKTLWSRIAFSIVLMLGCISCIPHKMAEVDMFDNLNYIDSFPRTLHPGAIVLSSLRLHQIGAKAYLKPMLFHISKQTGNKIYLCIHLNLRIIL